MEKPDQEKIIHQLGLKRHPFEGILFKQTYLSADWLTSDSLPPRYKSDKSAGTAIYYALTDAPDSFSVLHRLPTDEVYHFYLGDPVELLILFPEGESRKVILGQDILNDQSVQCGGWRRADKTNLLGANHGIQCSTQPVFSPL